VCSSDLAKLVLRHQKNAKETVIPILAPLAAALAALPDTQLTYITTQQGKPYTVAGFGNWFRRKCDAADLPHCSAHGLRKAMARRLAESGNTNLQGRSVTGQTDRVFTYYAQQANQAAMAEEAMANLERKFAKPSDKTS